MNICHFLKGFLHIISTSEPFADKTKISSCKFRFCKDSSSFLEDKKEIFRIIAQRCSLLALLNSLSIVLLCPLTNNACCVQTLCLDSLKETKRCVCDKTPEAVVSRPLSSSPDTVFLFDHAISVLRPNGSWEDIFKNLAQPVRSVLCSAACSKGILFCVSTHKSHLLLILIDYYLHSADSLGKACSATPLTFAPTELIPECYLTLLTAMVLLSVDFEIRTKLLTGTVIFCTNKKQVVHVCNKKVQSSIGVEFSHAKQLDVFVNTLGDMILCAVTESASVHIINISSKMFVRRYDDGYAVVGDFLSIGTKQLAIFHQNPGGGEINHKQFILSDFGCYTYKKWPEREEKAMDVDMESAPTSVITSALQKRVQYSLSDLVQTQCHFQKKIQFWRKNYKILQKLSSQPQVHVQTSANGKELFSPLGNPWAKIVKGKVMFGVQLLVNSVLSITNPLLLVQHDHGSALSQIHTCIVLNSPSRKLSQLSRNSCAPRKLASCSDVLSHGHLLELTSTFEIPVNVNRDWETYNLSVVAEFGPNEGGRGDADGLCRGTTEVCCVPVGKINLTVQELLQPAPEMLTLQALTSVPTSLWGPHLSALESLQQRTCVQLTSKVCPLLDFHEELHKTLGFKFHKAYTWSYLPFVEHPLGCSRLQFSSLNQTCVECIMWTWDEKQLLMLLQFLYMHLPDDAVITLPSDHMLLTDKVAAELLTTKRRLKMLLSSRKQSSFKCTQTFPTAVLDQQRLTNITVKNLSLSK